MDSTTKAVGKRVRFGTKAETLSALASLVRNARILPQCRFTAQEWQHQPDQILESVRAENWGNGPLIVRSSAMHEDGVAESHAGEFLSVASVIGDAALRDAVDEVFQSFGRRHGNDQVFVQPMLSDVSVSGVAFSIDPNNRAPYIVINYDDTSGMTNTVTDGTSDQLRTFYYYRFADVDIPKPLDRVIQLLYELEDLLNSESLDLEFAFTRNGDLYILQIRPLLTVQVAPVEKSRHMIAVKEIQNKLANAMRPHPYLHGTRSVFGVMPDWNPAEIIGVRPRPLGLSLYKELVTDNIWAYQRDNYGYKNLRSFPLLFSLGGLPYIDVRVSFNSFIPGDIEPELSEKLVNFYIQKLIESPTHHDKVEFEIIYSCYTLDLPERLALLTKDGFSESELGSMQDSLRRLTNRIIHGKSGLWRQDIRRIGELERRQATILNSNLDEVSKIYWLIEDCKRYGTLPFAGLARAGFIAVQFLRSLVNVGILSGRDYPRFMSTLDTISSRMARHFSELSRQAFLDRYGHLRPGTYDILSPRYDEAPERYFDWSKQERQHQRNAEPFTLSLDQLKRTEALLDEHGLAHDVLGLFDFIKAAIEGREYAKFVFTKSLSEVLTLFGQMGGKFGLGIDDCSYADIECVRSLYSASLNAKDVLERSVEKGREGYALTQQINLPPLIVAPEEALAFHLPESEPNFVTIGRTVGHVVFAETARDRFPGSILMIPSADPGYDWIFSQDIAGFITMYGGANSHMAIRAGELNIPAVIGAGESLYRRWAQSEVLELDCANKQVRILR